MLSASAFAHKDPLFLARCLRSWAVNDRLVGFQVVFEHLRTSQRVDGPRAAVAGLPKDLPATDELVLKDGECVIRLEVFLSRHDHVDGVTLTTNLGRVAGAGKRTNSCYTIDVPAGSKAGTLMLETHGGVLTAVKMTHQPGSKLQDLKNCLKDVEDKCDEAKLKNDGRVQAFRKTFVTASMLLLQLQGLGVVSVDSFTPLLVKYGEDVQSQLTGLLWRVISKSSHRLAKIAQIHTHVEAVLCALTRCSGTEASWLLSDAAGVLPGLAILERFACRKISTDNVALLIQLHTKYPRLLFHWNVTSRLVVFLVTLGDVASLDEVARQHARGFNKTLPEAMETFASEVSLVKLSILFEQPSVLTWLARDAALNVLEPTLAPLTTHRLTLSNDGVASSTFPQSTLELAHQVTDADRKAAIITTLKHYQSRRAFMAQLSIWDTDPSVVITSEALHALVADITSVSDLPVFFDRGDLSPTDRTSLVQSALSRVLVNKPQLLADIDVAVAFADCAVQAHRLGFISDHDWSIIWLQLVRASIAGAECVVSLEQRVCSLGAAVRQIHAQIKPLEQELATFMARDLARSLRERREHLVNTFSGVLFVAGGPVVRLIMASLMRLKPLAALASLFRTDADDVAHFLSGQAAEVIYDATAGGHGVGFVGMDALPFAQAAQGIPELVASPSESVEVPSTGLRTIDQDTEMGWSTPAAASATVVLVGLVLLTLFELIEEEGSAVATYL